MLILYTILDPRLINFIKKGRGKKEGENNSESTAMVTDSVTDTVSPKPTAKEEGDCNVSLYQTIIQSLSSQ